MDVNASVLDTWIRSGYGGMDDNRWPKRILVWNPSERRKRGIPRTSGKDGVKIAMEERSLHEGGWVNLGRSKL